MAAPINNQFWRHRSRHGREVLFASAEALKEAAYEYFDWVSDTPILETKQTQRRTGAGADTKKYKQYQAKDETAMTRPFTLKGLCLYLGVGESWWRDFRAKNTSEDFSAVISQIEDIIYVQKFEGAAVGIFNANIISRDLGLVDKKEHSGELEVKQVTFFELPQKQ